MARKPRIQLVGYPHHVIQRGANRQQCFFEQRDYLFYLKCLSQALTDKNCSCHAFVLMTNHVHLLVTPKEELGLSQLMKQTAQRYSQYVNRVYDESGSVWEGRYKSVVIENDDYALACYRYIELNPVKAGMVSRPSLYPWSSASFNGFGKAEFLISLGLDEWLVPAESYMALGRSAHDRQKAYRELFRKDVTKHQIKQFEI